MKNNTRLSVLKKTWEILNLKNLNIEYSEFKKTLHLNSNSIVKKILIISLIIFNLNYLVYAYLLLENKSLYEHFPCQNPLGSNQILFYSILIFFLSLLTYIIWLIYKSLYVKLIQKLEQNFNVLNN